MIVNLKKKPVSPMHEWKKKFDKLQTPFFRAYRKFDRIAHLSKVSKDPLMLTTKEVEALLTEDFVRLYNVFETNVYYRRTAALRDRMKAKGCVRSRMQEYPFRLGDFIFAVDWQWTKNHNVIRYIYKTFMDFFKAADTLVALQIFIQYPDGQLRFLHGTLAENVRPHWINEEYVEGPWLFDIVREMENFITLVDKFEIDYKRALRIKQTQKHNQLTSSLKEDARRAADEYHAHLVASWEKEAEKRGNY